MTQPPYPEPSFGSTESPSYPDRPRTGTGTSTEDRPAVAEPDGFSTPTYVGGPPAADTVDRRGLSADRVEAGDEASETDSAAGPEDPAATSVFAARSTPGGGSHEAPQYGGNGYGNPAGFGVGPADSTAYVPASFDAGRSESARGSQSTSQYAADLGATSLTQGMSGAGYGPGGAGYPTVGMATSGIAPPHAGAPTVGAPTSTRTPARTGSAARAPRRARLQLRHISVWSVLKFSCVLAIALFFVWLIVVGVLYGILDAGGVFNRVNDAIIKINGSGSKKPITAGVIFGGATIIGAINIVLFIALSTIGSVVYNLCADLVGGIEVTLGERE